MTVAQEGGTWGLQPPKIWELMGFMEYQMCK